MIILGDLPDELHSGRFLTEEDFDHTDDNKAEDLVNVEDFIQKKELNKVEETYQKDENSTEKPEPLIEHKNTNADIKAVDDNSADDIKADDRQAENNLGEDEPIILVDDRNVKYFNSNNLTIHKSSS